MARLYTYYDYGSWGTSSKQIGQEISFFGFLKSRLP